MAFLRYFYRFLKLILKQQSGLGPKHIILFTDYWGSPVITVEIMDHFLSFLQISNTSDNINTKYLYCISYETMY